MESANEEIKTENEIQKEFNNLKDNISYIVNSNNSFDENINSIILKLKDKNIFINVEDYKIIETNSVFSRVSFFITIHKNNLSIQRFVEIVLKNETFFNDLLLCYKKAISIFIINQVGMFEYKKEFVEKNNSLTKSQLLFLRDKINSDSRMKIYSELEKLNLNSIEDLTKEQASKILDSIGCKKR